MIAKYLNAILKEENDTEIAPTMAHIAKSIGITKIAQETENQPINSIKKFTFEKQKNYQ